MIKVRKPRKDQPIVDLADRIRRELGDTRPKNFGLYMKLIKEFGPKKVEEAFWKTVKKDVKDKVKYFLGILSNIKKRKNILRQYRALRAPLLKKVTPPVNIIEEKAKYKKRKYKNE
jgi:uncharacterized protein YqeY